MKRSIVKLYIIFIFIILLSCKNNRKDDEIKENENNEIVTKQSYIDEISSTLETPYIIGRWVNINNTDIQFTFNSDNSYYRFEVGSNNSGTWLLNENILTLIESTMTGSDGYGFQTTSIDTEYYYYIVSIIDEDNIIIDRSNTDKDESTRYSIRDNGRTILKRIEKDIWWYDRSELDNLLSF